METTVWPGFVAGSDARIESDRKRKRKAQCGFMVQWRSLAGKPPENKTKSTECIELGAKQHLSV
jgi:hypothetical protein